MSARMPAMALPASTASIRASPSFSRRIRAASASSARARSLTGTRDHSANAVRAARTARSTSAAPASGTSPRRSPVDGLIVSNALPLALGTHSPPR